jgi:hypothetical protein
LNMVTTQEISQIEYDRPKSSTVTPTMLKSEYRIVPSAAPNTIKISQYISLDPTAVEQEDTITISAGGMGDIYAVKITDDSIEETFHYIQSGGDTASVIASRLARRLDLHPSVRATAVNNIITVKGAVPGNAYTVDITDSTVDTNLVVASVKVASGTPKHALICDVLVEWKVDTMGYPCAHFNTDFFDGNPTNPIKVYSLGPATMKGNNNLDDIQTAQGILRPV